MLSTHTWVKSPVVLSNTGVRVNDATADADTPGLHVIELPEAASVPVNVDGIDLK